MRETVDFPQANPPVSPTLSKLPPHALDEHRVTTRQPACQSDFQQFSLIY
jgi:hypothetical protein